MEQRLLTTAARLIIKLAVMTSSTITSRTMAVTSPPLMRRVEGGAA